MTIGELKKIINDIAQVYEFDDETEVRMLVSGENKCFDLEFATDCDEIYSNVLGIWSKIKDGNGFVSDIANTDNIPKRVVMDYIKKNLS